MSTTRLGLPLPTGSDQVTTLATGPHDIRELATTLDDAVMFGSSVHSSRPTASLAGRIWLSTDTGQVSLDTGAAWVELARTSVASTPPGSLMMFAGPAAPDGWLLCNGAAVSRTTYAALYAAIGTTHGAGDGSTTFNVPDRRGLVDVGAGQGPGRTNRVLGQVVGAEVVLLSAAQSGVRSRTLVMPAGSLANVWVDYGGFGDRKSPALTSGDWSVQEAGSAAESHTNMQPSGVFTPIIKT